MNLKRFLIIFSGLAVFSMVTCVMIVLLYKLISNSGSSIGPTPTVVIPPATATEPATPTAPATDSGTSPTPTDIPDEVFCNNTIVCTRFNILSDNGALPTGWTPAGDNNHPNGIQETGYLAVSNELATNNVFNHNAIRINQMVSFEVKMFLDSNMKAPGGGSTYFGIYENDGWGLKCSLYGVPGSLNSQPRCDTSDGYIASAQVVQNNNWYTMSFKINPSTTEITFFFAGKQFGSYTPDVDPEAFMKDYVTPYFGVWSGDDGLVTGKFDDVRIVQP